MTKNLPADSNSHNNDSDHETRILNIKDFHYHGNDLKELRKLSEVNPDLAKAVVEGKDKENQRAYASYNFGLIVTATLLAFTVASFAAIVVYAGAIEAIIVIASILTVAVLVRVVLTGKWSGDTLIGKAIGGLIKIFGGKV